MDESKAGHWRARADEARAVAGQMTDPETKATMLSIAVGYDSMAERAEKYEAALLELERPPPTKDC